MAQAHPAVLHASPARGKTVAQKASNVRWRIFAIIFALTVINLIDRVSLSIAMPTIAAEFELTPSMQGLILSSFFWAYALLQIPGGWLIDRYGPLPAPVLRLIEVAELRLLAEVAGIASISREEGWLVVRFGAGLTRSAAMRLLGDGGLPGVKPADVVFASNQVRVRAPAGAERAWQLTQAIVARLGADAAGPHTEELEEVAR